MNNEEKDIESAELENLRKERDEYLAGWQRAKADFVNARKEQETQQKEFLQFAEERILRELIGLADTFQRAFQSADESNPYVRGFRHIQTQLMKILEKHGIEIITTTGKPFNPLESEALENVEVAEQDQDGVVQEDIEQGYRYREKVLKPSKVKVGNYKNN